MRLTHDQHALAVDTGLFITADNAARLLHGGAQVKGLAGVNFGGDNTGNALQDFHPETDGNGFHGVLQAAAGVRLTAGAVQTLADDVFIFRL